MPIRMGNPSDTDEAWPEAARELHAVWWQARIGRQNEIDASIVAKAEFEYLYDKPYDDKRKVRVAGLQSRASVLTACWAWTRMTN